MKLLYLHQHFSTKDGSSGTRSYEFARALIARGHSVTMVCGSSAQAGLHGPVSGLYRRGKVDGIDIIQCQIQYGNHLDFLSRVFAFLGFAIVATWFCLRERYDLLFATSTPLTIAIPALLTKPIKRKPFVFEVRDLWPEIPEQMGIIKNQLLLKLLYLLEGLAYRAADRIIALSPGMAAGIEGNRWTRSPVVMIPNGCDLELFVPTNHKGAELDGMMPGDRTVVFAGAHGAANGLDAVIDAARLISPSEGLKIVLIGTGKEKRRLQERGVNLPHLLFFDPMPKRELALLLPRFDAALQILANIPAFYYGTSPNKFFDYLASGLPVITNYPGWVADLIRDNQCGVAVPPGDPQALADAMRSAVRSSNSGALARALAEREFNRELLAARFCQNLEDTFAAITVKK